MTSSLSAVVDNNIIDGEFEFDDSLETVVPSLVINLIHRYFKTNGVQHETILKTLTVELAALQTRNVNLATGFSFNFKFLNVNYIDDLHVAVIETRANSVVTEAKVLRGDVVLTTNNPSKEKTMDENLPPVIQTSNTVPIEKPIEVVIYNKPLLAERTGERVALDIGEFKYFVQNTQQPNIVENSVANLLLDPYFQQGKSFTLDAPGYIVSESLDVVVESLKGWTMHIRNSNFLNAFSPLIRPSALAPLTGATQLAISLYYKLLFDGSTPCDKLRLSLNFYDADQVLIKSHSKDFVTNEQIQWKMIYVSTKTIPSNARFFDFALELPDISSTDAFTLSLFGFQAETGVIPTSRVVVPRIQDLYRTEEITLALPLYFRFGTMHFAENSVRGLLDTTQNGKSGFQWAVNADKFTYKEFDANGNTIINVISSAFVAVGAVTYMLYVTNASISFKVNDLLVSNHTGNFTINQVCQPIVGSLFTTNSTINSNILDFGIFRDNI